MKFVLEDITEGKKSMKTTRSPESAFCRSCKDIPQKFVFKMLLKKTTELPT
jgi:hypothetical protein